MCFIPKPRSRRNLSDSSGKKISPEEMRDFVVKKMCYLSGAYDLMSDDKCLELWNEYFYGGALFYD